MINSSDERCANVFVNGRMIRRVRDKGLYHFPIARSKIIHSIKLKNNFPDINYLDVSFTEGQNVDLSADIGVQYGIAFFERLDYTGLWEIFADKTNPEGSMDVEAYIANFKEYQNYEDNMFGLMHSSKIATDAQDWNIEGDLAYFDSPTRRVGTAKTTLKGTRELGYYAMGIAERQKFVNLIAPGGGRETKFIIQGLNTVNPEESQYDNANCELVVYNIFGTEVWRKKPYENDLDLNDYKDGTYYYEFRFTINGRPGAIQSYIDVKRMD